MVSEEKKQINTNTNHKTWRQSQNMTLFLYHFCHVISAVVEILTIFFKKIKVDDVAI